MKQTIIILFIISIITGCSVTTTEESTETVILNFENSILKDWTIIPLLKETQLSDDFFIDTSLVEVLIPNDYEQIRTDFSNDTVFAYKSREDFFGAYAHFVSVPSIDIFQKSSIKTRGPQSSIVNWTFNPLTRIYNREYLKNGITISNGNYILDSIKYNVVASTEKTYMLTTVGDTLDKTQYEFELRKYCLGKKNGTWNYMDYFGDIFKTEIWEQDVLIKTTYPNKN